jgi:hypothetical protein
LGKKVFKPTFLRKVFFLLTKPPNKLAQLCAYKILMIVLPFPESLERDSLDSSGDFPQWPLHVEERRLVICVLGVGNHGIGWHTVP